MDRFSRQRCLRSALAPLVVLICCSASPVLRAEEVSPMTLGRALDLAAEHQEGFLIAREQMAQVRLTRDRAWAAVFPQLSASGTFTHADREVAFSDRVLQRQDSLSGNISAILTVLRGSSWANITEARHVVDAAEHRTTWTERTLAFEVAQAFFTAQAAENLVEAAARSLETAREHLDAMEARRVVGVVLATDEGRARLEVVEAEEEVVRAHNAREDALDYLALLLGQESPPQIVRPPAAPEAPAEPPPEAPTVADDGETDEVTNRPDIVAVRHDLRAARASLAESWLDYLPTIAITGSFRATQNTGFSGDPTTWQLLVTLDWIIFDGGLRRATRRERVSQLRETQLRLHQLDRTARYELRRARRALETARATLRTTEERGRLADETRSGVLRRYRAGVATSLELVEADDVLRLAELALVSRRLELTLGRLALLQAAGLDPLGRESEE